MAAIAHVCDLTDDEAFRLRLKIEYNSIQEGKCFIWQGSKTSETPYYGIINAKLVCCGRVRRLRVHRLQWQIKNGKEGMETNDTSHLCHHSLCSVIQHLTLESRSQNNSRLACKNFGDCFGHDGPDCILDA